MTKKTQQLIVIGACALIIGIIAGFGYISSSRGSEIEARKMVIEFGSKLDLVSLTGPKDITDIAIEENYGPYATPEVIDAWQANPMLAPGKKVSTTLPDRIEIFSVEKIDENSFIVRGSIIEVPIIESEDIETRVKQPVTIGVERRDGKMVIAEFALNAY